MRTFLIADVRGYTPYTHRHGDEAASKLAARFADIARGVIPVYEGEVLELRGDEALCVFSSARQALRAAVELQRRFRGGTDRAEALPVGVGIGLDAGEAVPTQGGYRGGALNLAARLCSIAAPGEILASDHAAHLAGQVDGLRLVDRRPVRLKGMEKPVRFVEVAPEEALPPVPAVPRPGGRASQFRWRAGAVATALLLVAGVAALVSSSRTASQAPTSVPLRHDSVAVVNPQTGQIVADPGVNLKGDTPHIAAGEGAVWTYSTDAERLYRLDPRTLKVDRLGLGITPTDIATGNGDVWIADGWDQVLRRIDARSPTVSHQISLPRHSTTLYQSGGTSIAVGRSLIWVAQANCVCNSLLGITPGGLKIRARPPVIGGGPIAARGNALWVRTSLFPPRITELRPGHGTYTLSGQGGCCLALSGGYAWYAAGLKVWKIAPSVPLTNPDTIHLPGNADGVATGAGKLWVATDTAVVRIDPQTDAHATTVHLRLPPSGIAYYHGRLWLTIQ